MGTEISDETSVDTSVSSSVMLSAPCAASRSAVGAASRSAVGFAILVGEAFLLVFGSMAGSAAREVEDAFEGEAVGEGRGDGAFLVVGEGSGEGTLCKEVAATDTDAVEEAAERERPREGGSFFSDAARFVVVVVV